MGYIGRESLRRKHKAQDRAGGSRHIHPRTGYLSGANGVRRRLYFTDKIADTPPAGGASWDAFCAAALRSRKAFGKATRKSVKAVRRATK